MNNVPTRLLETTLNPFPPGTLDNVSHSVLKEYIQDTALKTGVYVLVHCTVLWSFDGICGQGLPGRALLTV